VALYSYEYPQVAGWTEPYNFSRHIRVFSTWHTAVPEELELIEAYRSAGFEIVLSNLTAFLALHAQGGLVGDVPNTPEAHRSTLNLQMQTAAAGVLRAKELGATHALKVRTDIVIKDFQRFLDVVGEEGCRPGLSFLHFYDYQNGLWAAQHFVPSPADYFYLGEIDMVYAYAHVRFQGGGNYVFGELYEMDAYCEQANITRLQFCQSTDWIAPRLPAGLIIWMHNTAGTRDMVQMPHAGCRACRSCEPEDCADRDICPPYSFSALSGAACPPNC